MDVSAAEALRLMREQRYAEAARLLRRVCAATPTALGPWSLLGQSLIAQGKTAELFSLIQLRQQQAADGLRLFYECLTDAIAELDRAEVLRVVEATPHDSLLFIVALFIGGIIAVSEGDSERSIDQIKAAGEHAERFAEHFRDDPALSSILFEHNGLEPALAVAQIEALSRSDLLARLPGIAAAAEFNGSAEPAGNERFILFSACDERYLDRFGESLVAALDRTGAQTVFHIHVVQPTPALDAKMDRLRTLCSSIDLRYSTERLGCDWLNGYGLATYYACARLVRLPEILDRYRRDVFMWDVDIGRVSCLKELVAAMAGYDLGYFEVQNTRPSLVCHLAAAYYSDTAAARRLADITAKYVLAKIGTRRFYWTLDQAALFCASRYLNQCDPNFRTNDFTRSPGVRFGDVVDVAGSATEKQAMRRAAFPECARASIRISP